MTDFLDELKARFADAQKRLQVAQAELQAANTRLQGIAQEFNSLQFLLNQENAKLQHQTKPAPTEATDANVPQQTSEINKTDMIRDLLRQQADGLSPTEIWKQVKTQMSHRAYLYSVLKRLKDKDEVIVRRGKYIIKIVPKTNAGGEHNFVQ